MKTLGSTTVSVDRPFELLPLTKDAMNGAGILYFYAAICAQVGERDLAIEQLKTLAQIPAGAERLSKPAVDSTFWQKVGE